MARGKTVDKGRGLKGQALKDFSKSIAILKAKGVLSKKVDARSQRATKYMQAKVRKFSDVIAGDVIALRAKPAIRDSYAERGIFAKRGPFLIIDKSNANQRAKIIKGKYVSLTTKLKNGEEENIVLPVSIYEMTGFVSYLKANPTLDGLLNGTEQFAFRLFGHNSLEAFPDILELANYIERTYKHLFTAKNTFEAFQNFQLVRFKGRKIAPGPDDKKIYSPAATTRAAYTRRSDYSASAQKLSAQAGRQKRYYETQSPEQRTKRLAAQALRTARNRQRKFNDE